MEIVCKDDRFDTGEWICGVFLLLDEYILFSGETYDLC